MDSLGYHGDLNSAARAENLEKFRQAGFGDDEQPRILVATDLAARGLDVPQVDHVVMFDFPLNPLDYLHRSGRTARGVGGGRTGNGRVTALVCKRDKVLATGIERAVQRGEPLDGLSSRKSDYLPGARLNKLVGGDAPRSNFRSSRGGGGGGPRNNRGSRSRNGGGRRGSRPNGRRQGRGRP
uniref:Helicase C-terminal domain-containing protein n=1 Tax=Grammatophora oceanica TaxID=210454 RepID=A0A7S1UVX5_9STRA|mmetsp:Transcript_25883/g.37908  ORF Transcript_25883/g.37908 Transcript_25883/m.37908 type:complete len:182 (+) Transcript_25883:1-546(+)